MITVPERAGELPYRPFEIGGLIAGMAAPIVFVVAVVAAGWATPGYRQFASFVSELGATAVMAWITRHHQAAAR